MKVKRPCSANSTKVFKDDGCCHETHVGVGARERMRCRDMVPCIGHVPPPLPQVIEKTALWRIFWESTPLYHDISKEPDLCCAEMC